jgi:hypothetical protein
LGTIVTNQNSIREKIKNVINSGNALYRSVQHLLSSHLLSKNVKIKVQKNLILRVVLYGREMWSLTFREECRLRVSDNSVLRRILGPKRDLLILFIHMQ